MIDLKENSLFFAPMEGITDSYFRELYMNLFSEWDYFVTDFFRVPTNGKITEKSIINHFGNSIYANSEMKNKTIFQILSSPRANTEEAIKVIKSLDIPWLDLNLGCPVKKVFNHKGGSYFLSDLRELDKILKLIRINFSKTFSVKIRVGISDDKNLKEFLNLFKDNGVDLITIHARTRDDFYHAPANWDYIKQTVQSTKIQIVGNGDINMYSDFENMKAFSGCHSFMVGRGALSNPYLAKAFKEKKQIAVNKKDIIKILTSFVEIYSERNVLGKLKLMFNYLAKDYEDKKIFLRTNTVNEFLSLLNN